MTREASSRDIPHTLAHHPIVWLGIFAVIVVALVLTFSPVRSNWATTNKTPADLFIQSVVNRDANLGWHQLCPSLQQAVSLPELISQVRQQHEADSRLNISLTFDYIGAHPRTQGGQIRIYVVTAHRPNGWIAQRTYVIFTQASGCVDDISTS